MADVDVGGAYRQFEAFTPALRKYLVQEVQDFAIRLQAWTIQDYLTGTPLHQRTGNLIRSLNIAPITDTEEEVSTSVGTNIEYAKVHEFGGPWLIPAHQRTMTMAFGRPVEPRAIDVRAYTANYPKRAFLAPALRDMTPNFEAAMDRAASGAANEANNGTA